MKSKSALIIGGQGQDGRLLSKYLSSLNYEIKELGRHGPVNISDPAAMAHYIKSETFDEIYHLAAFHHSSQEAWVENDEFYQKTFAVNFYSLLHVLEGVRLHSPRCRVFYAASSHIFAPSPQGTLLYEQSPLHPMSAYAQSKVAAKFLCEKYRREYGIFVSTGILFNHESELRADHFLSRKIIKGLVSVKRGLATQIELGNLAAEFDMGWAEDFVRAFHLILQADCGDDFVVATSQKHSVKDFVNVVVSELGLDTNKCIKSPPELLKRQPMTRIGDNSKLKTVTGWEPSVSFAEMIKILLKKELDQKL